MIKIFHNFHLKILSLLAAIIVWFLVVSIGNTVFLLPEEIPVSALNLPKNMSLASELAPIKVYLKTDPDILKTLTKADFEAFVDVSNLAVGEHQVPISIRSLNAQASILKIAPQEMLVKLAPSVEKEVGITMTIQGAPAAGYSVETTKADPEKVTIIGAQEMVAKIENVEAILILDGSEKENLTRKISLKLPENLDASNIASFNNSVQIEPEEVSMDVTIAENIKQKVVNVTPQFIKTSDPTLLLSKINISPPTVTISGDPEVLNTINSLDTTAIDAEALLHSTTSQTVQLKIPAGIELLSTNAIHIALDAALSEQKNLFAPIIFTKLNSSFKVDKVSPAQIKVTVVGEKSYIKNLKDGDITVNINLQNVKGSGPLLINTKDIILPPGVNILDFSPDQVQLETSP